MDVHHSELNFIIAILHSAVTDTAKEAFGKQRRRKKALEVCDDRKGFNRQKYERKGAINAER